jgi:UDP-N-acetylmuramoylalanine--D-glutamate ligase
MDDLSGKRVTVMGLGRFGGGVGVTRYLAQQGCDVLVTDTAPQDTLTESVAQIRDLVDAGAVTLRLGEHNVGDFTTCDLVIANPAAATPWDNRFLRAAQAAGIPITTEIGLLIDRLPTRDRVIGVTGSAGKSTTAAMIAHALNALGHTAHLGGNIGGSLLTSLDKIAPNDWIVLELSSAMLHWIDGWSPHVAVITNLSENHLDWHGSMEHYTSCKAKILASQTVGDIAVLGTHAMPFETNKGVQVIGPTDQIDAKQGIKMSVPGEHNVRNAVLAASAAAATGGEFDEALKAIASFPGLPHRLEFVGNFSGVRVYNDSKSTTPDACIMALEAIQNNNAGESPQRILLVAGGYDKGMSLESLVHRARSCAQVWTIGQTGDTLAKLIGPIAHPCQTLETATKQALSQAQPGDTLLLSPACASWDQFTNYQQRGQQFIDLVKQWARTHAQEATR